MIKPRGIVKTTIGLLELEAPAVEGFAFIGRTGWLGAKCSCGWMVSGRSMAALELGLQAHQLPEFCPAWKQFKAQEADEPTV